MLLRRGAAASTASQGLLLIGIERQVACRLPRHGGGFPAALDPSGPRGSALCGEGQSIGAVVQRAARANSCGVSGSARPPTARSTANCFSGSFAGGDSLPGVVGRLEQRRHRVPA